MDFPDMDSLKRCAECHQFRAPLPDETEDEFRVQLADFVEPIDFIESQEIRNKVGWDKFSPEQNFNLLRRRRLARE